MQSVRVALVMLVVGVTACGANPRDEQLPPEMEEPGDVMADDDVAARDAGRVTKRDASLPAVDELDAQLAMAPDANGGDAKAAVDVVSKPADAGARAVDARVVAPDTEDASSARRDAAIERRDAASDAGDNMRRDGAVQDAAVVCTVEGQLSYSLTRAASPTPEQNAAYMRIRRAMDTAVQKYNCYADITRNLQVAYDPSVAGGAEGRANGTIRFGSQASMNFVRAMHEISHALGVGSTEFRMKVANQIFTGSAATELVRSITGDPRAVLTSDGSHFSPYGLSTDDEYRGEQDAAHHCAIVAAIRSDLGL